MGNTAGYDEQQQIMHLKINRELSILPHVFTQYVDYLNEKNKSNATILSYLVTLTGCLRTIYRDYDISDESFLKKIKPDDITQYFEDISTLSIKSIQNRWTVLNLFFGFLVEINFVSINPMTSIGRPSDNGTRRKLNYLTRSQLDRLLMVIRYSPTKFNALRDETIIRLAISTGIDITDIINLNINDVDCDAKTVSVVNKKGIRKIPIGRKNIVLLDKWKKFRQSYFNSNDTPALFVSTFKKRMSCDAISHMLRNYCEEANIPIITYKDLKSTMVYLLAKEHVSMEAILNFLDVSDYLMIVQAYDAAIKENNVNVYDKIDNLFDTFDSTQKTERQQSLSESTTFELGLSLPRYDQGITITGYIQNRNEHNVRVELRCALSINGVLTDSDGVVILNNGKIAPNEIEAFAIGWYEEEFQNAKIQDNDYIVIRLLDTTSNMEYPLKYIYKEDSSKGSWHLAYD